MIISSAPDRALMILSVTFRLVAAGKAFLLGYLRFFCDKSVVSLSKFTKRRISALPASRSASFFPDKVCAKMQQFGYTLDILYLENVFLYKIAIFDKASHNILFHLQSY